MHAVPKYRIYIRAALVATVVQFVAFKLCYPRAGFINGDSYVYLQSAMYNSDINTYPVGYSKFLRIFSAFTRSDTALVAFQYLAIQAGILAFLFTLFDLYSPGKRTRWLMFAFGILNPVFLYLANYVSSDALFTALSLFWFATLLRLMQHPNLKLLIIHALILLITFTIRYNALYYPGISAIGFLLTRAPFKKKLVALALTIVPALLYIVFISSLNKQAVGIRQFTAFSGWQLANNALYAYRYVDSGQLTPPPAELQPLDRLVRHYFDTSRDLLHHPQEMLQASTVYMWDPRSPLQRYMALATARDSTGSYFRHWARMGPLYAHYGAWLIQQYPGIYGNYYLLQNAIKFYTPPGEFLFEYNMGRDTVGTPALNWFRYPSNRVAPAFGDYRVRLIAYMPILAAVMNILFLLAGLGLIAIRGLRFHTLREKAALLAATFWTANFVFSVTAAPVTLRYQLFAILVATFFSLLLLDRIYSLAFVKTRDSALNPDQDQALSTAPDKAAVRCSRSRLLWVSPQPSPNPHYGSV